MLISSRNKSFKYPFTVCPPHQTGARCDSCIEGYYGNPYGSNETICFNCNCNMIGSQSFTCNDSGQCNKVNNISH